MLDKTNLLYFTNVRDEQDWHEELEMVFINWSVNNKRTVAEMEEANLEKINLKGNETVSFY